MTVVLSLNIYYHFRTQLNCARSSPSPSTSGTRTWKGPRRSFDVNEKKNSVNPVTQYDVPVENLSMGEIKEAYLTFKFIGEVSSSAGSSLPELTDEPTFCVDPIGAHMLSIAHPRCQRMPTDSTTNFVHGFPFFCISLGLIYQK
ncbi:hypothetical protein OG21DRAFT_849279 [Imleria badia]|nr:hypothetical protein OG21DRAFT_849279 [Imleria badia]